MSSANRSPGKRRKGDSYQTPPVLAQALARILRRDGYLRDGDRVLEPSAGEGAFARAFVEVARPSFLATVDPYHPKPELPKGSVDKHLHSRQPFEQLVTGKRFDLVGGNPPYSLAETHVRHGLSLLTPGGTLAFLLRLAFFESQERIPFWREHPAEAVYVLSERPSFTGGGTDSTAYAMIVWRNARPVYPTRLEVVSWKEARAA